MEHALSVEDIHVHLLDDNLTLESQKANDKEISCSTNDENPKEMEQQSSSPVDNGGVDKMDEEENNARRRRNGVVEASDTVTSKRMNARVMRKKLGEGFVSEMPGIFNKKL